MVLMLEALGAPLCRTPTKVMVVTVIGGASGAMSSLLLHKNRWGWWDVGATNNGILAGLVSITAGCATLEPEGAFISGAVGGLVYYFSSNLLVRLRVRWGVFMCFHECSCATEPRSRRQRQKCYAGNAARRKIIPRHLEVPDAKHDFDASGTGF